jgi:hypothetical protein
MVDRYNPETRPTVNTLPNGEEIFYVSNPASDYGHIETFDQTGAASVSRE